MIYGSGMIQTYKQKRSTKRTQTKHHERKVMRIAFRISLM